VYNSIHEGVYVKITWQAPVHYVVDDAVSTGTQCDYAVDEVASAGTQSTMFTLSDHIPTSQ